MTGPAPEPEPPIGEKLDHLRVAYQEALGATLHQDDKVGRFLAGIAFLVAGALVFTNPTVLQATYLVGDTSLPLPALAIGTFLVLIILSLFLYVLAMSAPLTIPPRTVTEQRSHQYFLLIAAETSESWRELWNRPTTEALVEELAKGEVDEIRNLAIRADLKLERSNEGSALFVLALLFFLLGTVLSIHAIQQLAIPADPGQATRAPQDLAWSLPLRALIGSLLALFPFVLIYQRLRAEQRRLFDDLVDRVRDTGRRWDPLHGLLLACPAFVLLTVLPDHGHTATNEIVCVAIALSVIGAVLSLRAVLLARRPGEAAKPPRAGDRMAAWVVTLLALGLGALAVLSVLEDRQVWQLGTALAAAVSPLAANLFAATFLLNRRLRHRLGERLSGP
jgi:hypothetical protein